MANATPIVIRGDWFRTAVGKCHCCRMYCLPGTGLLGDISPGTYIGPVHDVDVSAEFWAILVPFPHSGASWDPMFPSLVWISVYCAHNFHNNWNRSVAYAIRVPRSTCVEWGRNGWVNTFFD